MMWCTTARLPGRHLRGLDPLVLGESGIDDEVLVADLPFGRHLVGLLRHVDDLVRLAAAASPATYWRGGQIGRIALRRAVGHPALDQLLLLVGEPSVVGELAVLRIGVPRRHALVAHDLVDHLRPADRFLVGGQRERGDLAAAVTFDAALLEDAGDLLRVRDLGVGLGLADTADQAADRVRAQAGDRLAGEQLVERLGQVLRLGFPALHADAVLVVDPAAIADHALVHRARRPPACAARRTDRPPCCPRPSGSET